MKYIILLSLFIICFALMYSTSLELIGLGMFFVVNLMYSAMLGNDLFAFFKNSNSGSQPTNRWTTILATLILIALSMNFTSSVLTMMTLGNLQSKFGAKGEKIMLSPEYRKELSTIEGLFVATIVLITVLSFRLYFSPTQMAENMFAWVAETIPEGVVKWGHLLLATTVMGLALGLFALIDRHTRATKKGTLLDVRRGANYSHAVLDKDAELVDKYKKHPELPDDFRTNFMSLFWVLMSIFLIYLIPTFIPAAASIYEFFKPKSTKSNTSATSTTSTTSATGKMSLMMAFFTSSKVSTYTLFKILFVPLTLAIAVEANKLTNEGDSIFFKETDKEKKGVYPGYQSVIVLGVTTMIFSLFTLAGNIYTYIESFIDKSKGLNIPFGPLLNGADALIALIILIYLIDLQVKRGNIFDAPINTTTDTQYIYHKILTSFLFLFPAVYIILIGLGMRNEVNIFKSENPWLSRLHTIGTVLLGIDRLFPWNFVDAFWVIRTFLVAMAVGFAGLTINSYNKISEKGELPNFDKYYSLKELFGSFIVFLMVILPFSLFDTKSIPRILTVLIEYLSPIAVIIMMCLLVVYSNHLSKLSNKELVGGISSEDDEAEKPVAEDNPPDTERVSHRAFDGVEHPI